MFLACLLATLALPSQVRSNHVALLPWPTHNKVLMGLRYSPDGKRILSAGGDQSGILWNPQAAVPVAKLIKRAGAVVNGTFSETGKYIALEFKQGAIGVWDSQTGAEIYLSEQNVGEDHFVSFSPSEKWAVVLPSGDIVSTGLRKRVFQFQPTGGDFDGIEKAEFTDDGKFCVACGANFFFALSLAGDTAKLAANTEHKLSDSNYAAAQLDPADRVVYYIAPAQKLMAFSLDTRSERLVASDVDNFAVDPVHHSVAYQDKRNAVFWVSKGQPAAQKIAAAAETYDVLEFSPTGQHLCASTESKYRVFKKTGETLTIDKDAAFSDFTFTDKDSKLLSTSTANISFYDLTSMRKLYSIDENDINLSSAVVSPDETSYACLYWDGRIEFRAVSDGRLIRTRKSKITHEFAGMTAQGEFSPDSKLFAYISGYDVVVEDVKTGIERARLDGREEKVYAGALHQNGASLLISLVDGSTVKWDFTRGSCSRETDPTGTFIRNVASSFTAKQWATRDGEGNTRVYDFGSKPLLTAKLVEPGNEDSPTVGDGLMFSHDGKLLVSACGSSIALGRLTQPVKDWKRVKTNAAVSSLALSRDDRLVAFGLESGEAGIVDLNTERVLTAAQLHGEDIMALEFSDDGQYLFTVSTDRTVKSTRVRDLSSSKVLHTFSDYAVSLQLSPDGNVLAVGSADWDIVLLNPKTGELIRTLGGHVGSATAVCFSADSRLLFSGSVDGSMKAWSVDSGKLLATCIAFTDGTWAVVTPEGRYDASNGGDVDGVIWVVDGEPVELRQLKDEYYEPGLLAKIIKYRGRELEDHLRSITPLDKLDIKLPPDAEILDQRSQTGTQAADQIKFTLTDRGGGIGSTDVFVNNKLALTLPAPAPSSLISSADGHKQATFHLDTKSPEIAPFLRPDKDLAKGEENTVRVVGHSNDSKTKPDNPEWIASRAMSSAVAAPKSITAPQPNLFIVATGASDYKGTALDLRYAAKDARDFAKALETAGTQWLGKDHVHTYLFTSDSDDTTGSPVSKDNIRHAVEDIKSQAKSTDIVVVFFSGHGTAGKDKDYRYLPADLDSADPSSQYFRDHAISGEELSDWLRTIPASKQAVVLDTCASGEFMPDKEGGDQGADIRRSWERMKDRTGVFFLAGCSGDAVSYESSRYNQGLLTYSLLKALKSDDKVWRKDPSTSKDPFLDVQAWFRSAEDEVPRLAESIKGVQKPEFKSGDKARTFDVGQLTDVQRSQIQLSQPLPILLAPSNVKDADTASGRDTLQLKSKLVSLMSAQSSRGRGNGFSFWQSEAQVGAFTYNVDYKKSGETVSATVYLIGYRLTDKGIEEFDQGQPLVVQGAPEEIADRILKAVVAALPSPDHPELVNH